MWINPSRNWLTNSFISEISLSTSSMNWMMKSTSLCFSISSVWTFVMRNEMSKPWKHISFALKSHSLSQRAHLDWFSPQYEECLRSLRQKPRKLVHQNILYFIRLLDLYANARTVYTRLDKDFLVFVSSDSEWIEENFWRGSSFDFWDIVSLWGLWRKIWKW